MRLAVHPTIYIYIYIYTHCISQVVSRISSINRISTTFGIVRFRLGIPTTNVYNNSGCDCCWHRFKGYIPAPTWMVMLFLPLLGAISHVPDTQNHSGFFSVTQLHWGEVSGFIRFFFRYLFSSKYSKTGIDLLTSGVGSQEKTRLVVKHRSFF